MEKGCWNGTVGNGMGVGDCGKGMLEWDCGERNGCRGL